MKLHVNQHKIVEFALCSIYHGVGINLCFQNKCYSRIECTNVSKVISIPGSSLVMSLPRSQDKHKGCLGNRKENYILAMELQTLPNLEHFLLICHPGKYAQQLNSRPLGSLGHNISQISKVDLGREVWLNGKRNIKNLLKKF